MGAQEALYWSKWTYEDVKDKNKWMSNWASEGNRRNALITWDIYTGVYFTPLYQALK
jgi:hypothetical protein